MASNNKLLGSGKIEETPDALDRFANRKAIGLMFSKECMEGKLYYSADEKRKLEQAGWKDHPGKVMLLPGHEKLYKEEMEKELPKEAPKEVESKKEEVNKQADLGDIWGKL